MLHFDLRGLVFLALVQPIVYRVSMNDGRGFQVSKRMHDVLSHSVDCNT